jgi:hypothetical protein
LLTVTKGYKTPTEGVPEENGSERVGEGRGREGCVKGRWRKYYIEQIRGFYSL